MTANRSLVEADSPLTPRATGGCWPWRVGGQTGFGPWKAATASANISSGALVADRRTWSPRTVLALTHCYRQSRSSRPVVDLTCQHGATAEKGAQAYGFSTRSIKRLYSTTAYAANAAPTRDQLLR
jgi:hypothetical protein